MKTALASVLAAALASPVQAQDGEQDWDLHRDPGNGSLLAFTTFDIGLSLGFRCNGDGAFAAVAAGLPASDAPRRELRLKFRDEEAYGSMWTTTTDNTVAVADYPAMLARSARRGGELRLTVPRGSLDGRDLTYSVDLPPSNAAIDAVLNACERPLVDPRDALLDAIGSGGLTGGATWARAPRPAFPETRYASGFVVVTCLAYPDGRLSECEVESEHPHDAGFGEAALRGARRARVAFPEGPPPGPFRVGFHVAFRLAR